MARRPGIQPNRRQQIGRNGNIAELALRQQDLYWIAPSICRKYLEQKRESVFPIYRALSISINALPGGLIAAASLSFGKRYLLFGDQKAEATCFGG